MWNLEHGYNLGLGLGYVFSNFLIGVLHSLSLYFSLISWFLAANTFQPFWVRTEQWPDTYVLNGIRGSRILGKVPGRLRGPGLIQYCNENLPHNYLAVYMKTQEFLLFVCWYKLKVAKFSYSDGNKLAVIKGMRTYIHVNKDG